MGEVVVGYISKTHIVNLLYYSKGGGGGGDGWVYFKNPHSEFTVLL